MEKITVLCINPFMWFSSRSLKSEKLDAKHSTSEMKFPSYPDGVGTQNTVRYVYIHHKKETTIINTVQHLLCNFQNDTRNFQIYIYCILGFLDCFFRIPHTIRFLLPNNY